MAIKKTELYASLWASCDELRGGMDASQYKNYILTLLFVKYVSDKYAGQKFATISVPAGASFADMVACKGQKDIGDKMNKIVGALADANEMGWLSSPDNDFNNEDRLGKGQAMVDTLTNLVGIFQGLDLGKNRADGDDLLGDAYEYLMRHFATESGKSKGQFYTPAEVSQVVAKILGITAETRQDQTAYDPTCGSGSLLLKVNDEAPNGLSLYGQEKDNATAALAKMNMILHDCSTAEIWQDDTLAAPRWKNEQGGLRGFDYAVANPPFSVKAWSNGFKPEADSYRRFDYGIPPEKNGDYAFLLHILKSLNSTGKGAVILPHGVLFRGNAEADIRRNLLKQGYIKGIIGLPANLFYGTGIPACIIMLDKAGACKQRSVFMLDASKGFIKDGNKNRLRAEDIHKIVDVFNKQLEQARYSRLVPYAEIAEKNDFNLNIPRYIDASEAEDQHDLHAHMNGGIPQADIDALEAYWQVFPNLRATLFQTQNVGANSFAQHHTTGEVRINSHLQLLPHINSHTIKTTILNHPEFIAFKASCLQHFHDWASQHRAALWNIQIGDLPKALIFTLAEDLLARFADLLLLDKYDVYQILMDYWQEVMQDDVYLLCQDGWQVASTLRQLVPIKDKNDKDVYKEVHDFESGSGKNKQRYKSDILPVALVIQHYFAAEQQALLALQTELEQTSQNLESLLEEHSGEDGLLEEAKNDKGKLSPKSIKDRLKQTVDSEEIRLLKQALTLLDEEARLKKAISQAQEQLTLAVFQKIPQLSVDELKPLVIQHKWLAHLEQQIQAQIERITQQLSNRIKTLEQRYAQPLPALALQVEQASLKVAEHLKKMGVVW